MPTYERMPCLRLLPSFSTQKVLFLTPLSSLLTFLETETDNTCKRNAFAALVSISHDKALAYLSNVFDGIPNADELLQLVELEFIRKDAVQNSQNKVSIL